jgi:hypothetical protein
MTERYKIQNFEYRATEFAKMDFSQVSFTIAGICFVFFPGADAGGTYQLFVNENFERCGSSGFIDFSDMVLDAVNDTVSSNSLPPARASDFIFLQHTFLTGGIKYKKEIIEPWKVDISSTRFNRNQWQMGEINRRIPDLCPLFTSENELWYPITQFFKHVDCPIAAGVSLPTSSSINVELAL